MKSNATIDVVHHDDGSTRLRIAGRFPIGSMRYETETGHSAGNAWIDLSPKETARLKADLANADRHHYHKTPADQASCSVCNVKERWIEQGKHVLAELYGFSEWQAVRPMELRGIILDELDALWGLLERLDENP